MFGYCLEFVIWSLFIMSNIFEIPAKNPNDILNKAIELAKLYEKPKIVVVAANDEDVLEAVSKAQEDNIADVILVGDKNKTADIAKKFSINLDKFTFLNFTDEKDSIKESLTLASTGKADVIMKGFVSTSKLMKAVLSPEFNLKTKNTLSHTAVIHISKYHKLFAISDGGVLIKPDVEQKKQMLVNSETVMKALGIKTPKVAFLNNVVPTPLSPSPFVENLSFEFALSKETAKEYSVKSEISGDADIIIASYIETVNIVIKSLIYFANASFAGVILGAKLPISLCSRTDTMENKMLSLSLACIVSHYLKYGR